MTIGELRDKLTRLDELIKRSSELWYRISVLNEIGLEAEYEEAKELLRIRTNEVIS